MEDGQSGKLKVGAIIQARFDSSRFPGKVLKNLPFDSNETILSQIYKRLLLVSGIDEVIIATSNEKNDDVIADYCKKNKFLLERGSKNNVLDRFVNVAKKRELDVIIRVTGDNPILLIDILERAIEKHIDAKTEYTRNLNLPHGTGFEIVNSNILENILFKEKITDNDREHVTIFIKDNKNRFQIQELDHKLPTLDFRLTVDYPSDYAVLNILFQYLNSLDYKYNFNTLRRFVLKYKWLKEINYTNYQKKNHVSIEEEINSAKKILSDLGFKNLDRILKK